MNCIGITFSGGALLKYRAKQGALIAMLTTSFTVMSGATAYALPAPNQGPAAGGTTVTVPAPELRFASVGLGDNHANGLGVNGMAYSWGTNMEGSFGPDAPTTTPVQARVPKGLKFTSLVASGEHSTAIGADGNVYSWGINSNGELGNGTTEYSIAPVKALLPDGVSATAIAPGGGFTLALGDDGNSYAWGANWFGNLGDGTLVDRLTPIQVKAPQGVTFTQISSGRAHILALGNDGNTYAWGSNAKGQLGVDSAAEFQALPMKVQTPQGIKFTQVAAGFEHSVAIGDDGRTYAWGENYAGRLGDGTEENQLTPVPVITPSGVSFTLVAAGEEHTLAIGDNGKTYAWGENWQGEIGDGTFEPRKVPVEVQLPAGVQLTQLAAERRSSIGLSSDGRAFGWGQGIHGQIGDGTDYDQPVPTEPTLEITPTAVTFGGVPGTELTDNGDGILTVVTPEHAPGTVDVAVEWTLVNTAQPAIVYADGFTYLAADEVPTVTDPADQTVELAQEALFSVTATGVPAPEVRWETSSDAGATWRLIDEDPAAAVSDDGLTLTITGSKDNDQHQYRAIAANSQGTATSGAATLTVTSEDADGGETDDGDTDDGSADGGSDGSEVDGGETDAGGTDSDATDTPEVDDPDLADTGYGLGMTPWILALGAALTGVAFLGARKLRKS
ncbi:hypothetical protein V5R04_05730 [Jonesiaceae bacterium BS-20]|uniref:Ig-like domain-containing protein n=1 Tax=Jonesiaceae bacterium BS-20 TaxID=3120821 RepID=A0AAU7DYH0_9MICO